MTRISQTVWTGKNGKELLTHKHGEEFYIPLSNVNMETLRELRDALNDAILNTVHPTPEKPTT